MEILQWDHQVVQILGSKTTEELNFLERILLTLQTAKIVEEVLIQRWKKEIVA
jgi:hypothetical protein